MQFLIGIPFLLWRRAVGCPLTIVVFCSRIRLFIDHTKEHFYVSVTLVAKGADCKPATLEPPGVRVPPDTPCPSEIGRPAIGFYAATDNAMFAQTPFRLQGEAPAEGSPS